MDSGPQAHHHLEDWSETIKKQRTFVFNEAGQIEVVLFDDFSYFIESSPFNKSHWIDPHQLANASLLYSVASELKIVPGLFMCGDNKIITELQSRISPKVPNKASIVQRIVDDWRYILEHLIARPFAMRDRPPILETYHQGGRLGCFGSFEMFLRYYMFGLTSFLKRCDALDNGDLLLRAMHLVFSNLKGKMFYPNSFVCDEAYKNFLTQASPYEQDHIDSLQDVWDRFKSKSTERKRGWWGQNRGYVLFELKGLENTENKLFQDREVRKSMEEFNALKTFFVGGIKRRGFPKEILKDKYESYSFYCDVLDLNAILLDPKHLGYLSSISCNDTVKPEPTEVVAATQALLYDFALEHHIFGWRSNEKMPYLDFIKPDAAIVIEEEQYRKLENYELYAIANCNHEVHRDIASQILTARLQTQSMRNRLGMNSNPFVIGGLGGVMAPSVSSLFGVRSSCFLSRSTRSQRSGKAISPRHLLPQYLKFQQDLNGQSADNQLTPDQFKPFDFYDKSREREFKNVCVIC